MTFLIESYTIDLHDPLQMHYLLSIRNKKEIDLL